MTTTRQLAARTACLLAPLMLLNAPATAAPPEAPPAVTARTWLNAQASGTQASAHKQTLSGPIMGGVYQKMRKQLASGKDSGEASASSEDDNTADTKGNPLGDLSKVLGNTKP